MRIHVDVTLRADEGVGKSLVEITPILERIAVAVEKIATILTPEPPEPPGPVVGLGAEFGPNKDR